MRRGKITIATIHRKGKPRIVGKGEKKEKSSPLFKGGNWLGGGR